MTTWGRALCDAYHGGLMPPRRTVYAYSRGDLVPPAAWIVDVSRILGQEVAA